MFHGIIIVVCGGFMKVINLSSSDIDNLESINLSENISNSESDIFLYHNKKGTDVLKKLYYFDKNKYDNKIRTLLSVDNNTHTIPNYFIKPKYFVSCDNLIQYWASQYILGFNLKKILNDDNLSFEVKKNYLKRIGMILEEISFIRNRTPLKDFYIGDLHEDNFLVDLEGNLMVCDIDSIKINGNKPPVSKYINPFSLFNRAGINKYMKFNSENKVGDYIINQNTDLYCYNIILLNFICGCKVNDISIKGFYDYLNIMESSGLDYRMIEIFNKILSEEDNCNPYDFIDSISYRKVLKIREKVTTTK